MAARILNRIGERAERVGHVGWALRAAELRLALPFEAQTRERLEAELGPHPRAAELRGLTTGPGSAATPAHRPLAGQRAPTVVSSRQWNWPIGSSRTSLPR